MFRSTKNMFDFYKGTIPILWIYRAVINLKLDGLNLSQRSKPN